MLPKFDCIEEYIFKNGKPETFYRSRFYSEYLKCMVEISGDNGLHKTKNLAIQYAKNWAS